MSYPRSAANAFLLGLLSYIYFYERRFHGIQYCLQQKGVPSAIQLMPVNRISPILSPAGPPLKIWVLAPTVPHTDENIHYYYDFSQSIAEYERVFADLQLCWQWQEVSMVDFGAIIDQIAREREEALFLPVVLNLCDGDEINGSPGISVLHCLEEKGLLYTGAEAAFYQLTTSKIDMKAAFDKAGVATPRWMVVQEGAENSDAIFAALSQPVIVKPAVSGGSMGVGTRNVVHCPEALEALIPELKEGYRGWDLSAGGLIAESFIDGPEYTCFLTGDYRNPAEARIFAPVQRVFHPSLPDHEKFLSFDRLWEIYEQESAMPGQDHFYEYAPVPDPVLADAISTLSWQAYAALQGTGYTRVDIRQDRQNGQLFVLEANAQCGISEDENFTSIGAILKFAGCPFSSLIGSLIRDALTRPHIRKLAATPPYNRA